MLLGDFFSQVIDRPIRNVGDGVRTKWNAICKYRHV